MRELIGFNLRNQRRNQMLPNVKQAFESIKEIFKMLTLR